MLGWLCGEQIAKPMKFAFETAMNVRSFYLELVGLIDGILTWTVFLLLILQRSKRLTVVDKANVLDCSRLWRKVAKDVSKDYPEVKFDYM